MNLEVYPTYEVLSEQAATIVINQIKEKPTSVLCFASGDTPKLTCQRIVALAKAQAIDFTQCIFIGLDEWVSISPTTDGSCHKFFYEYLIDPLGLRSEQVRLFDGLAKDLVAECHATDQFIKQHGGIDLMLVGVGMNGHIGFNEPGVSENLQCHVIDLDPLTISVGQKYFTGEMKLRQGITVGFSHLMDARHLLLLANGSKKSAIMRKALEGEISMEVPASIVRKHRNATVLLDKEAAGGLKAS